MQGKMGVVKRKTLYFTAPRQVEVREEPLPALGADELFVETTCSAISAGTEMLVYQGRFPKYRSGFRHLHSAQRLPISDCLWLCLCGSRAGYRATSR